MLSYNLSIASVPQKISRLRLAQHPLQKRLDVEVTRQRVVFQRLFVLSQKICRALDRPLLDGGSAKAAVKDVLGCDSTRSCL